MTEKSYKNDLSKELLDLGAEGVEYEDDGEGRGQDTVVVQIFPPDARSTQCCVGIYQQVQYQQLTNQLEI